MQNMIKIENSSNLDGYFYEPLTKMLFIEFKGGGLYGYDIVPPEVFEEFEKSASKGSFLYRHIKNKFKCTKFKESAENPDDKKDVKKDLI